MNTGSRSKGAIRAEQACERSNQAREETPVEPTDNADTQNEMEGEVPISGSLGPILVIIPTYNESENIARIISRTREAVPDAHILIADDNSPDGTASWPTTSRAPMTTCMSCTGSARKAWAPRTSLVLNGV